MTPFFHDDHLQLWGGDCREILRELPDESVHCVVTSPPYWGLRDYGTASWEGGDPECDHLAPPRGGRNPETAAKQLTSQGTLNYQETTDCRKCGARRIDSQLGLEATPEEFVANMVDVFREVRRVLRKDGTLWLNLGDSYAGARSEGGGTMAGFNDRYFGRETDGGKQTTVDKSKPARPQVPGLKPKDLVGIPWRVAFALQADGWYLRSDIIWAKPNPMPESVTDRPTKAHEYLFLLTRSPRYYYDAEAVREPHNDVNHPVVNGRFVNPKAAGGVSSEDYDPANQAWATNGDGGGLVVKAREYNPAGRNLRSVWNIATEPYPGAHFATFPRKLVEPCVKAGTSERGVCPECGAPWVRVVERTTDPARNGDWKATGEAHRNDIDRKGGFYPTSTDLGWRSSCTHEAEPVPAVVLDPFAGSGTTLFVAQALGRRGVGIDLSPDYLKQALERNRQTPLGLVG